MATFKYAYDNRFDNRLIMRMVQDQEICEKEFGGQNV